MRLPPFPPAMTSANGQRRISVMRRDTLAMVVLARGDAVVASWPLPGCDRSNLALVDRLVRLQLAGRRCGSIYLRDAPTELVALLDPGGVAGVVPCDRLRQVSGETEGGDGGCRVGPGERQLRQALRHSDQPLLGAGHTLHSVASVTARQRGPFIAVHGAIAPCTAMNVLIRPCLAGYDKAMSDAGPCWASACSREPRSA